jgi:phenylalanyl-tRNA synthetase beta chain
MDVLQVDDERAGGEPILRPSLLPSLARVAAFNRDHGATGGRLFEQAATFALDGEAHRETVNLGLLHEPAEGLDNPLRETRGVADRLIGLLRGPEARLTAEPTDACPWLAPAAVLRLDGQVLGTMGLLAPAALRATGLEGTWAAAELGLPALYEEFPPDREATSLPAFPAIDRDLTVVVDDAVTWAAVTAAIDGLELEGLERTDYVGVYRGTGIPAGRRALTLRLRFRRPDRTLVHEEVDPHVQRVVDALRTAVSAELRG